MCERYALPDQSAAEREFVPTERWWKFARRFNVSAGQYVPAIRLHGEQSEAVMMRWGLIPAWAEGKAIGQPPRCIGVGNIEDSTLSRVLWQSGQRCILPASGFYAWRLTTAKYRQPHFVNLVGRSVFGLAAVWDRSVGDDDDVIESCAIVGVPANALMRQIANTECHMPAILMRKDYERWLCGSAADATSALQTYSAEGMQAHAVSPRVNSPLSDDVGLIRPVRLLG
jgi:putative SOS response-associated peptidase YedK